MDGRITTISETYDSLAWVGHRLASLFILAAIVFPAFTPALGAELQNGVPFQASLAPRNYNVGDFIEVPANANELTVTLQGQGGSRSDLDLYLKFGRSVMGNSIAELNADADFRSDGPTESETLLVRPTSNPPLQAGKWYISALNLNDFTTLFTLTASFTASGIQTRGFQPRRGMWWNPQRSGAGIDLQLWGTSLYATWYTYDNAGQPTWYIGGGPFTGRQWAGNIQRFHYDAASGVASSQTVGTMKMVFLDQRTALMDWEMGGQRGNERLETFTFAGGLPDFNYTGTWYEPAASGYGLTVGTQGSAIGAVLYFYDSAGEPRWATGLKNISTLNDGATVDVPLSVYLGGFCPNCPFTAPTPTQAGSVTLRFSSDTKAVMSTAMTLPQPLQGTWNRSQRQIAMLSETSPITAKDLIDTYGTPTLFNDECLNHAPTPGAQRWDPVPGVVRYSTWLYALEPGRSRAFTLVNQEVLGGRVIATEPRLATYPNPHIDPRRFGCGEARATVTALVPGSDKRFSTEGSAEEPELLLAPGAQLKLEVFAIQNKTLFEAVYVNDKLVGLGTL